MKLASVLFVFLYSFVAAAQILPTSSGSCSVSPSGLLSCSWMSAITLRKLGASRTVDPDADEHSKLFVTHFVLSPGAPLNPLVKGRDALVFGTGPGELQNEIRIPSDRIYVTKDLVMLMPKEQPYLLRNVGKQNLELVVIEIGK